MNKCDCLNNSNHLVLSKDKKRVFHLCKYCADEYRLEQNNEYK